MIHTPGETDDQTTIWFPEMKAVLPGDNIYKCFPNLYTIRGSPARSATQWYESLKEVIKLGAEYMVPSHTQPLIGADAIKATLKIYKNAIKYVHAQTIHWMNQGLTADQIIEKVTLPQDMKDHPYLQEYYGTVAWSIRGVFTNYLGWFSGDPKDLDPMTDAERAARMIRLVERAKHSTVSPAEIILRAAQDSHRLSMAQYEKTGRHRQADDKWGLELVDYLTEIGVLEEPLEEVAKIIKISTLRALGSEAVSANGHNYYMTYAGEVERGISHGDITEDMKSAVETSTIGAVLGFLCYSVDTTKRDCEHHTVGLHFSDVGESYQLTLRNGVCDATSQIPFDAAMDAHVSTTTGSFKSIMNGEKNLDLERVLGDLQMLKGSFKYYKRFMGCFNMKNSA